MLCKNESSTANQYFIMLTVLFLHYSTAFYFQIKYFAALLLVTKINAECSVHTHVIFNFIFKYVLAIIFFLTHTDFMLGREGKRSYWYHFNYKLTHINPDVKSIRGV